MKFILFSPEKFKKIPLRKVEGCVFSKVLEVFIGSYSFQVNVLTEYGSELTSSDAGSDGYPEGYSK